eukprot:2539514-Rhodomonas_salina.2
MPLKRRILLQLRASACSPRSQSPTFAVLDAEEGANERAHGSGEGEQLCSLHHCDVILFLPSVARWPGQWQSGVE